MQQLLLFSRKMEMEKKALDLNHEVEQARSILERIIPKMIDIELRLASGLWAINADPVQVEQVLLNLASNAADAMPDGGRLVMATDNVVVDELAARRHSGGRPGRHVRLTVSDSGAGMDQAVVENIFEPFFTTKEIGKGTGLGLASVYGAVKSHGGYVTCDSEIGRGTTFRIFLPAISREVVTETAEKAPKPLRGGSETVLVVDDEKLIRDMASEALRRSGYGVLIAASGEEALEIYAGGRQIDLVIMDLGMPGMGGFKCLREITRIEPRAKVLIASGYSSNDQIRDHAGIRGGELFQQAIQRAGPSGKGSGDTGQGRGGLILAHTVKPRPGCRCGGACKPLPPPFYNRITRSPMGYAAQA